MQHRPLTSGWLKALLLFSIILLGQGGCPPQHVKRDAPVTTPPKKRIDGWVEWKSDAYGFRMVIPRVMKMKARGRGNWGGFHGVLKPIDLYGLAWLKHFPKPGVMKNFAVKHIGIPANKWRLIHQGTNKHGFKWFKTFRATEKGKFAYILLGHGPKGAYILHLTTTPANQLLFNAQYVKWYMSIRLF